MTANSILALYSEKKVSMIHLYNVPGKAAIRSTTGLKDHAIHFYTEDIIRNQHAMRPDRLQINLLLFSESQEHHTYFNRKLYIGPSGEIKNAPECKEVLGNINEVRDLIKIISGKEFQRYWQVKKSNTDVCRHCEFMHMCVDKRIPIRRNEKEWFHKKECDYNPFIGKWKGEPDHKTLAEIAIISNKDEFKIAKNKNSI
jgi:radical SAM protein with 4Fe4S-binding SPASM domain